MTKRPTSTILFITAQRLVRADFSGKTKPQLLELWEQAPPDTDDLSLWVEAALSLGPKPAKRVWVLCSELWTQTLSIATGTIADLSSEELARALSFEVEPYSGLGAFESALGYQLLEENREQTTYWVTQLRNEDLDNIDYVIRQAGGALAGMAHPAGLPRPVTSDASTSWQRTELWPDAVVCLQGDSRGSRHILVINSDPDQNRWQMEQESWQTEFGPAQRREMLLKNGELVHHDGNGQPGSSTEDTDSIAVWLTAWAEQLAANRVDVPLICPAPQPLSQSTQKAAAVILMLLAVTGCFLHHWYTKHVRIPPLQAELNKIRSQSAQLQRLQNSRKNLEKVKTKLDEETAALQQKAAVFRHIVQAHERRLAGLLAALAQHQPDDLVIQKIQDKSGAPVIHGIALRPQPVSSYSRCLDRELRPLNWQAVMKEVKNSTETGLYTFEIHLKEFDFQPGQKKSGKAISKTSSLAIAK